MSDTLSPYKGLDSFADSEQDALLFFGRERDAAIVEANLVASRVTILYGPSGVGKSSLLRARVARALRALPEEPLVVVFSHWGEDPVGMLAAEVAAAAGISAIGGLVATAAEASASRDVFLILDQTEDYFLYHAEGGPLEDALAEIVTGSYRIDVLLSIREDSLAQLDRFKARIPHILGNYLRLDRLDRQAGEEAIRRPLGRLPELGLVPVDIEPSLVAAVLEQVAAGRIVGGVGGRGEVDQPAEDGRIEAPYLQLVMERIWEVEREAGSRVLRAATLAELGGAERIVTGHLERALRVLTPEQQEIAARILNHLVTPSGTKIAHLPADLAQYASVPTASVESVLVLLSESRVLRRDEGGRFEIFHDVLAGAVLAWRDRFDSERALERERRQRRRAVTVAAVSVAGLALAVAVTLFAFVQRSHAQDNEAQARSRELQARAVALEPSDPELATILAAEAVRIEATPGATATLRDALLLDHLLAVLPAGGPVRDVAVSSNGRLLASASDDGNARLYAADSLTLVAKLPHADAVTAVVFAAGVVVTASRDGTARVWSEAGEPLRVLRAGTPLVGLESSGERLLAATSRGAVEWSLRTGRRTAVYDRERHVREACFAGQDGRYVVTRAANRYLDVFDSRSRQARGQLDLGVRVDSLACDAASPTVAAGGARGAAAVWDVRTPKARHSLDGHRGSILGIEIDELGVLTASADATARAWDPATGAPTSFYLGHANPVSSIRRSALGTAVFTTSYDETARTWDARSGAAMRLFAGHTKEVVDGELASDDRVAVTASLDGTARVWDTGIVPELQPSNDAPPGKPGLSAVDPKSGARARAAGNEIVLERDGLRRMLRGHTDRVASVAFSPDGERLVTASRDWDAIVWDVQTGKLLFRLTGKHYGALADARFSPDGQWIVTAGPVSAGLWGAADGDFLMLLRGAKPRPVSASFDASSRRVTIQESDGTVRSADCAVCGTADELLGLAEERRAATRRAGAQ